MLSTLHVYLAVVWHMNIACLNIMTRVVQIALGGVNAIVASLGAKVSSKAGRC